MSSTSTNVTTQPTTNITLQLPAPAQDTESEDLLSLAASASLLSSLRPQAPVAADLPPSVSDLTRKKDDRLLQLVIVAAIVWVLLS